jgi:magnesium chelatase family protein
VRERVLAARAVQRARSGVPNAQLGQREMDRHCRLAAADQALLERAVDRLRLSARAHQRILRVARTIADLAHSERIGSPHLMEAIAYRRLDRASA